MTRLLLFLLAFCVLSARAAIHYVDFADGNDANDGTSTASAFKTIPGTYKTDGSDYLNAAWGAITTSAKVGENTTIQVKAGTAHAAAAGGFVWVGRDYYTETGCTNIVIQSDSSWGTGNSATLDGAGMTIGIALFLTQIDGLTVRGFNLINSTVEGLEAKEHQGTGNPQLNTGFYGLSFSNNGTSYATDAAGAGAGQLSLRWPSGCVVSNCTFNGNQQYINGLLLGDDHKYPTNVTVTSCTSTNHKGDEVGNDAGIGFKCFNSTVTWSNCVASDNLKGWDNGEAHGDGTSFTVKLVNCTAQGNGQGFNFNSAGGSYLDVGYSGTVKFYLINSLALGNTDKGLRAYAGPFDLHVVHSVFVDNGTNDVDEGANIHVTPDTQYETNVIRVFARNNILLRPGGSQFFVPYFVATNNFTIDSDWNAYQQRASEYFCRWSYYASPAADFSYGANGPGRASGDWYSQYGATTDAPFAGTGHYHADAQSKGTGCTGTNLPALSASYTLTAAFAGAVLSTNAWYISDMGNDRAGRARSTWDIGAFEYVAQTRNIGTILATTVRTR